MLAQYEAATTSGKETTFSLTNYFTTYLKDNEQSKLMHIRLLPGAGPTPFEEVYVHSMKVEDKNRKFVCPSHTNDDPCPFCDTRSQLLASGDKDQEETAKQFNARLMYIAKVIDRDKPEEGPKFWRFPRNFKKDGVFDKIIAIHKAYKMQVDLASPETGMDLVLNVERVKNNRGGSYPNVNSIQAMPSTPLSTDERQSAEWLSDTKTWEDVYSVKSYDYLEIITNGGVPYWDKKLEKFVNKEDISTDVEDVNADLENELTIGTGAKTIEAATDVTNVPETANVVPKVEIEDDVPF